MDNKPLRGKKIAILIANGFNETDMTEAGRALIQTGAILKNISVDTGLVNSWSGKNWGLNFTVDAPISNILAADFDMLFVPGGERSMAKLSTSAHAKRIIRGFIDAHKPIAMQGDAVALLALSERAEGFSVCGDNNCKEILENAGATWNSDAISLSDNNLVTGHGVKSNLSFINTMLNVFCGTTESEDKMLQSAA